jgi:hypothetical protein
MTGARPRTTIMAILVVVIIIVVIVVVVIASRGAHGLGLVVLIVGGEVIRRLQLRIDL